MYVFAKILMSCSLFSRASTQVIPLSCYEAWARSDSGVALPVVGWGREGLIPRDLGCPIEEYAVGLWGKVCVLWGQSPWEPHSHGDTAISHLAAQE